MKGNVIEGNFKEEKKDYVWVCDRCDGDTFKLLEDGRIKCADCSNKTYAPPAWLVKQS